jgi:hypothetical protein
VIQHGYCEDDPTIARQESPSPAVIFTQGPVWGKISLDLQPMTLCTRVRSWGARTASVMHVLRAYFFRFLDTLPSGATWLPSPI